jgi:hypothetical protein
MYCLCSNHPLMSSVMTRPKPRKWKNMYHSLGSIALLSDDVKWLEVKNVYPRYANWSYSSNGFEFQPKGIAD